MSDLAFLMLQSMKSNGGVGYTEHGKVIVDTELPDILDSATQATGISAKGNEFEVGKNYTVTTDSGTYLTVCKKIIVDEQELIMLGNAVVWGMEDTGEPFIILLFYEDEQWLIGCIDFNCGTHMTVSTAETIHTIDPKFLPPSSGGGLPVVELTTLPTPNGAELTFDEWKQIYDLNGMPCILLCTVYDGSDTIPFRIVASSFTLAGNVHYMAVSSLGTLEIAQSSKGWKFYVAVA
jgi:hypothetical protein